MRQIFTVLLPCLVGTQEEFQLDVTRAYMIFCNALLVTYGVRDTIKMLFLYIVYNVMGNCEKPRSIRWDHSVTAADVAKIL